MKKLVLALFSLIFILSACSMFDDDSLIEDGKYFASSDVAENGWMYYLAMEVKDGVVVDVEYDGLNMLDGDKRTKSKRGVDGDYNLGSDAIAPIQDQLKAISDYILSGKDLHEITFDDSGKSDAISTATIKYEQVVELYDLALKSGVINKSDKYEDGYYFGVSSVEEFGGVDQVAYYVYNGIIVAAHFDSLIEKDGLQAYKSFLSKNGDYDLGSEAISSMHEQLQVLEENLVEKQACEFSDLDAVSGATIKLEYFAEAFANAEKK